MDTAQIAALKRKLSLVGRTREHLPFLYTPAGPDGQPALLVGSPRLDTREVLSLTRTAKSKDFVRGEIGRSSGQLVFTIRSGSAGLPQLIDDLQGLLGALIPPLQTARVVPE